MHVECVHTFDLSSQTQQSEATTVRATTTTSSLEMMRTWSSTSSSTPTPYLAARECQHTLDLVAVHHDRHRVMACDNLPCYQVDCSTGRSHSDTVTAAHVFEDTHYYGCPKTMDVRPIITCTYMYLHVLTCTLHVHYMYITCSRRIKVTLQ